MRIMFQTTVLERIVVTLVPESMREFCVYQPCIVVHGHALGATNVPVTF